MNINTLFFYGLFFLTPLISFSQQQKILFFDQNWKVSSSKESIYYSCDCYALENDDLEGPFICYDPFEVKIKSYNFKNNVLDGEIFEYYNNGELKLHAFYNNGTPVKEWKEWNEKGELIVDKTFDENNRILKDKKKKISDYEKMYFGTKEFSAPVYGTKCILKRTDATRNECSKEKMLEYYQHPPLPPSYFEDNFFQGKTFIVKLRYKLSNKGKVIEVDIIETSGDDFLDELGEAHVMNMLPFESAKEYENPINYWITAELFFRF